MAKIQEIWKPIQGYEGFYEVSNFGRVRRGYKTKTFKIIKSRPQNNGYPMVVLSINNSPCGFTVHRLVANAFLKNIKDKAEVNHKDGNKLNNHVDNLEWVTSSENKIHARALGLVKNKTGEDAHNAVLSNIQAEEMRILFFCAGRTRKSLAREYNVGQLVVQNVIAGRTYKKTKCA